MDTPQNIIVIFTDKSDQVLSEIMKKYHLEEPLEKMVQNTLNGKLNNVVILNKLATSFAKGEISEKDLADSVQKETGVAQQAANDISKEIITNLAPTLKKMSEEEIVKINKEFPQAADQAKKTEESAAIPKMKAPIEVEKILAERQGQTLKEKIKEPPIKKAPAKGPAMPREGERPTPKQPRKPDSYREPIG